MRMTLNNLMFSKLIQSSSALSISESDSGIGMSGNTNVDYIRTVINISQYEH